MFNYRLNSCEVCTNGPHIKTFKPYHCLQCQQYYKFEGQSSLANIFHYGTLHKNIAIIGLVLFSIFEYFGDNLTVMALVEYFGAQTSFAFYFIITHFPKNTNPESKALNTTEAEFQTFLKKMKRDDLIFMTIIVFFHIMKSYVAYLQKLSLFSLFSLPILGIFLYLPFKSFMEINEIQKN